MHKDTIDEINTLFNIKSKIKSLKLYLPHFKLGADFFLLPRRQSRSNRIFKICVEKKPDFIPAYIMLGKCYISLGIYTDALRYLLEGYKLNSEYPDLANTLGVALSLNKEYQKATSILQQALKKNPEFDEANFNLGIALFRSTIDTSDQQDKSVVPPQGDALFKNTDGIRNGIRTKSWLTLFENTMAVMRNGDLIEILISLEQLQLKLITHIKIDPIIESFYLKFMYGGRELSY